MEGVELFYREAGPRDAPTILPLHGFPTSSRMFRDLIPALAQCYEWHGDSGNWFCSYGDELWECAQSGPMRTRQAGINDVAIRAEERRFH